MNDDKRGIAVDRHKAILTTSWDDGSPNDIRLSCLLEKYNLPATFYIPISNSRPTLSANQIREIGERFEIGGHTQNHVDLLTANEEQSKAEIKNGKDALENILGKPITSFCFPLGHFRKLHLQQVKEAGFSLARTVELMSVQRPMQCGEISLMPTTVQAYNSGWKTYLRNNVKRGRLQNFAKYLRFASSDWCVLAKRAWSNVVLNGGVFHLWGHSWEIEEENEWNRLEELFEVISADRYKADFLNNGQLA